PMLSATNLSRSAADRNPAVLAERTHHYECITGWRPSACLAHQLDSFPQRQPLPSRLILALQTGNQLGCRHHLLHRAHPLPGAPDVLPGLGLGIAAGAEVHL